MNMKLQRTLKLVLKPTEEQKQTLLETIEQYKFAYNYTCKVGWSAKTWNGIELHKLTYYTVREKTSLPSQLVISARVVATESLKSAIKRKKKGLKSKCPQSNNPAIRYDRRSYTVWLEREEVSLATVKGRQKFKVKVPDYFKQYLDWRVTSANLKYDKRLKKFFLNITCEKEFPDVEPVNYFVGVDLGLRNLAVVSTPDGKINKFFDGGHIRAVSERYFALRKRLQSKGTPSAKRHLKTLSQKEKRFRTAINHRIAKEIVSLVPAGGVIVLEKLKGIRKRIKVNKQNRRWIHSWNFAQLQQFIEYKAQAKGIRVVYVDARYTSQKCSRCGHISRSNRIDQSHFVCKHCSYSLNADLNASRNIVKNYLASLQRGEVGTGSGISLPVGRCQPSQCSGATC
ncbi:transposase, IS605 OrfB family [Desulfurobacterium thermolithotrophum DSM 11699]|uniref:Transposase, IS605 OrfB family n=2 Tax=Desulfurobacterium thermolithotrophum TaxID=64160 RepID=F0S3R0_DESTD|nr:transposase, IS605 OrfB family [Desulfurobacterium thermolithotrophum DSM 11699]